MSDPDTSADFIIRLNAGTSSAIEQAVNRYRDQLCRLVAREMGRRLAAREEPEDAVDSALVSFCRGVKELRFHFDHSGAMWKLLETITRHKMLHHIERENADIRNADHEQGPVAQDAPGREPLPEDAVQVSDLIEKAIEGLEPPDPEICRLHLEGYTRAELAAKFNCTEAKIRAKLDRIHARLARLLRKGQR
ncbi:MAG: RNA polymerase sigma factor [Thermoguttaceae bacterium]